MIIYNVRMRFNIAHNGHISALKDYFIAHKNECGVYGAITHSSTLRVSLLTLAPIFTIALPSVAKGSA